MTRHQVRAICKERLQGWTSILVDAHATPLLLLGIGHDDRTGEVSLLTTEDMDDILLLAFVQDTARMLAERIHARSAGQR